MPGADHWDRETESGQVLVDRRRHWLALEWVLWLNVNDGLTYQLTCESAVCCAQNWLPGGNEGRRKPPNT